MIISKTKSTNQASPSTRDDWENLVPADAPPKLATAGETQSLPGSEEQESKVRALHTAWLTLRRKSISVAFELGCILADLKAKLKGARPKRDWEPYVRDHLGIEPRTASNYMRISRMMETIDGLSETLKPETISEMGIRELLDHLTEIKKAGKTSKDQQPVDKDSEAEGASGSHQAASQSAFRLLDGSQINLRRLHWTDGLVPRSALESWLSKIAPDSADSGRHKLAAKQRVVIQIAAGINRACGKAAPSNATELVESAFEVIRFLLRESQIG